MKKQTVLLAAFAFIFSGQILSSDAFAKDEEKVDSGTIYARLGGQASIDAAVDLFYVKVLADDRVNFLFDDVNMTRQIRRQKEFLSAAFGGPVTYTGKDLREAHKNLDLREADFTAIAENLQATLDELKVDKALSGEIMTLVASTKDAVLNRPDGASKTPKSDAGK